MILYKRYTIEQMLKSNNESLKVEGYKLISLGFPQTAIFQVTLQQIIKV